MTDTPRRTALVKIIDDYAMDFSSAIYVDTLAELQHHVESGVATDNVYIIPFVLTCAAALEATLNDHLVNASFQEFGGADYKAVADSYLSMNFRGRLTSIVPLLTKGKFVVRTESGVYQTLCRLIKLRNELVHPKSFFSQDLIRFKNDGKEAVVTEKFRKQLESKALRTIDSKQCGNFFEAINKFYELFLYPLEKNSLIENELIINADLR